MRIPFLSLALVCLFLVGPFSSLHLQSADLTPEQIASIQERIKQLRDNLNEHLTSRNQGAGDVFLQASQSSRTAVELYLKCQKMVNFDRKGLKDSDFRSWKEAQSGNLSSDRFTESLQIQLRYLALSCQAAEVKEIDDIFGALTSYVASLSQLKELPDRLLMDSVAGSVFAQAYDLESLLGKNQHWEPVPFNIGGIYSKTILPFLRAENPDALMAAWDKRIDQESRIVAFYEREKEKELRGKNADEKRRKRNEQKQAGGKIMEGHNKDKFLRETLPLLKWSKLKDMYQYVDQVAGAKAMLDFANENLEEHNGERYLKELQELIDSAGKPESTPAALTPSN